MNLKKNHFTLFLKLSNPPIMKLGLKHTFTPKILLLHFIKQKILKNFSFKNQQNYFLKAFNCFTFYKRQPQLGVWYHGNGVFHSVVQQQNTISTDVPIIVFQCGNVVVCIIVVQCGRLHQLCPVHNGGHSRHYWTRVWTKMPKDNPPNQNQI